MIPLSRRSVQERSFVNAVGLLEDFISKVLYYIFGRRERIEHFIYLKKIVVVVEIEPTKTFLLDCSEVALLESLINTG